jgi:hypothetical protein
VLVLYSNYVDIFSVLFFQLCSCVPASRLALKISLLPAAVTVPKHQGRTTPSPPTPSLAFVPAFDNIHKFPLYTAIKALDSWIASGLPRGELDWPSVCVICGDYGYLLETVFREDRRRRTRNGRRRRVYTHHRYRTANGEGGHGGIYFVDYTTKPMTHWQGSASVQQPLGDERRLCQ